MSMESNCGKSNSACDQALRNLFYLLAISLSVSITGCGQPEPKEISAATSGYMPPKETKDKSSVATKTEEKPAPPAASGDGNAVRENADGLSVAPSPPSFQPGQLDPKIAAKSYMTLQLGNPSSAKALVDFLNTSSRAFMELVADSRNPGSQLPIDVLLDRGMAVSRMKLEAAQRLEKLASNEAEKTAATLGIMEAYSQMASFKDVTSMDNLREMASKEMKSENKKVAQQAKAVAVGLQVADYDAGIVKSNELTELISKILTDGGELNGPNLSSMMQAIDSLGKHSEEDSALELAQKVEVAFRDNPDNALGMKAWDFYAGRLKEMADVVALGQTNSADDLDPMKAKAMVEALMAKVPSPWTAFFLVQIAVNVEYSGRSEVAKAMFDAASTQIDKIKDPDNKEELERNCQQFSSRYALPNKPLDLSELVDLSGKPLDFSKYKGKVVLVDFWATWCGPCLKEIPNIEEAYAKFNSNGFEVISVNLDQERSKLDSFMASKKAIWPTYVSSKPDEVGFNTPLAKKIGIAAIPFIAILGKDGNVAAVHVRGRKLEGKIQELLAKE